MESSESQPADRAPELAEPAAPATPDGTPPYADPAPEELDLSGPDRSLLAQRGQNDLKSAEPVNDDR
jgi:hypothetical protein